MQTSVNERKGRSSDAPWVPWRGLVGNELSAEDAWSLRLRLQAFRFLAALAVAGLSLLVVRGILFSGAFPWADLANTVFFAFLLVISFVRPSWLRVLAWLGLVSFFINALDGLAFSTGETVAPTLVLLPLFILYGSLLGDIWLISAAMIGVFAIYGVAWSYHGDLDNRNMLILTNLCLATLFTGAATFGVWLRHCRLERMLDVQARHLRRELDIRLRIQALVTHDIRNPLTALMNAADLDDRPTVEEMAGRIAEILNSADDLATGSDFTPSATAISDIWTYLNDIFAARLAEKEQTLSFRGDSDLVVMTDLTLLCNSVLGNLLSNAIKFSACGSAIEVVAEDAEDFIRIAVSDRGPGFPPDVFDRGVDGRGYRSRPGTEGETGSGYGLRIAALCAARLNGRLEIQNHDRGGAASVLLPQASARSTPTSLQ